MTDLLLRMLRNARKLVVLFFDGIVLYFSSPRVLDNRVLVVKLDAIGDFVIWLDAAKALVDHYHLQGYSVVLIGNSRWASWAREMNVADEVWDLNVIRFMSLSQIYYRWKWLMRIREAGFAITIQPTYSREILSGDSVVRASGSAERLGSTGDESNTTLRLKSWSDRWYTHLITSAPTQLMEFRRNAEFIRSLGLSDYQSRLASINPSANEQLNMRVKQPYVVIVATASWSGKEWPIESFIEISQRLMRVGLTVVVVGATAERERQKVLIDALPGKVVDMVGKTSLGGLAEVLRFADMVLTNDTSAVHIGAAVGVPVVCIMGGGHFGRFAPYEIEALDKRGTLPIIVAEPMSCYGCNWQCQHPRKENGAVKCINDISVEKVWEAVTLVLAKSVNQLS